VWLKQKWADLFAADFEVLLYDLTSTYFEGEMEQNPKAKRLAACRGLARTVGILGTTGFSFPDRSRITRYTETERTAPVRSALTA
jgi:hypothetical protein